MHDSGFPLIAPPGKVLLATTDLNEHLVVSERVLVKAIECRFTEAEHAAHDVNDAKAFV
jgi:hypothetical protein